MSPPNDSSPWPCDSDKTNIHPHPYPPPPPSSASFSNSEAVLTKLNQASHPKTQASHSKDKEENDKDNGLKTVLLKASSPSSSSPCDASSGKVWISDVSDALGPHIFIDSQEEFVERWICESSSRRRRGAGGEGGEEEEGEGQAGTRGCVYCARPVCDVSGPNQKPTPFSPPVTTITTIKTRTLPTSVDLTNVGMCEQNCRFHLNYTPILEHASTLSGGMPMRMDSDILPGRGGRNAAQAARVYSRYVPVVGSWEECNERVGECCVHRSRIGGITYTTTMSGNGGEFTAPICLCSTPDAASAVRRQEGEEEWMCIPCFKAVFADVRREGPCGECARWFPPRIPGWGLVVERACSECGGVVVEEMEDERGCWRRWYVVEG